MNLLGQNLYNDYFLENKIETNNTQKFMHNSVLLGSSMYKDYLNKNKLDNHLLHKGIVRNLYNGKSAFSANFNSTVAAYGIFIGHSVASSIYKHKLLNYNEIPYTYWDKKDYIYLGWD